ncbi:peroxide stress protein YaaA [Niveibacterium sp. SC-1]|uniref:peroxide stress protein YaaA n=1 Tax=Niveibacterium sp. SC-1 TaxID=3135646 RepID=UPI00311E043F
MLILLSPAKTLDFESPSTTSLCSQPELLDQATPLIRILARKSPAQIAALMSLSDKLAVLNVTRYAEWRVEHEVPEAKQAVLAFAGDVYDGLDAASLPPAVLEGYLQTHLGILSGLYGLLRPLDLVRPYRLEMGTRLANRRGADLYDYWGKRIASAINARLDAFGGGAERLVVNLASQEYFRGVRRDALKARVITPLFQERRNGEYKVVSFNAKRARGAMTRYAAEHGVSDPQQLKSFDRDGYAFDAAASNDDTWFFRREMP